MVSNSDYVQRQTDHGIVVLSIIGYFGQLVRGPHRLGCEILAQGLTGLIEYSYQQVATSFPEAHLEGTPRLSVLGPEHSKDG